MTRRADTRLAKSFQPILPCHPKIAILGSMPGIASLEKQEYYAHPANAFWPIMAQLLGFPRALPYALRVQALRDAGVALWDVLMSCERRGSADANIMTDSEQPNEIDVLLEKHLSLKAVFLNGNKAYSSFDKHILPLLNPVTRQRVTIIRLPSTSAAHARVNLAEKTRAWRVILRHL